MSYTFDTPPQPMPLDDVSIKHDVVLLLDTFFHNLIFHGNKVRNSGNKGRNDTRTFRSGFSEINPFSLSLFIVVLLGRPFPLRLRTSWSVW